MVRHLDDIDKRPLMSPSEEGTDEVETFQPRWYLSHDSSPWRRRILTLIFVTQGLLNIILIGTGFYLYSFRGPANPIFPQLTYSPAQDVISFVAHEFYEGFGENITIYQKDPSDEVDKAWEDLYSVIGISEVPRETAAKLANKTYPIAGTNNYIVELDVFHQLHCLNTLRMALTPEYYLKKNLTDLERTFLEPPHARHCLDAIRQSLTCNADVSTYVWHWDPRDEMVKPTGNVVHTCKDYGRIVQWAKEHHLHSHFDNTVYVEDDLEIPIIYA